MDIKHKYQTRIDFKHLKNKLPNMFGPKKQILNRLGTLNTKQGLGLQNFQNFGDFNTNSKQVWTSNTTTKQGFFFRILGFSHKQQTGLDPKHKHQTGGWFTEFSKVGESN